MGIWCYGAVVELHQVNSAAGDSLNHTVFTEKKLTFSVPPQNKTGWRPFVASILTLRKYCSIDRSNSRTAHNKPKEFSKSVDDDDGVSRRDDV